MKSRKLTRQSGVEWLRAHPEMRELGFINMHVAKEVQARIVNAMKRDGVVAPTTYTQDVCLRDWLIEAWR